MGKSRFIELMAKCLDKSASAEELKELEFFLEEHPHFKKMHDVTSALRTGSSPSDSNMQDEDINTKLDALWVNIKNTENHPQHNDKKIIPIRRYLKWVAGVAAILVIGVLSITFYSRTVNKDNMLLATADQKIDVPYGQMVKLTLSDGTKVRLNAGSHFGYPATFVGNRREVTLDGEGFFEVTKDAQKPFLVHTAGLTVRVLGTVFNVRAYKHDKKAEATLFKGKVQIELTGDPDRKIVLTPREKLTVLNDAAPANHIPNAHKEAAKLKYELSVLPVVENDEYQENAWLENKLVFTNTEFEDVAVSMERKYKVQFVFEDEALKKEQLSGVLKDENLESALFILKQITSFQSKVAGHTVYISRLNK
jgi:transmembrane sensor